MPAAGDEPTLGEIARTLARLEAKLDAVAGDHEERIRKVERWLYAIPPTLILALASIVAAVAGAT